jgi:hypothetical protein
VLSQGGLLWAWVAILVGRLCVDGRLVAKLLNLVGMTMCRQELACHSFKLLSLRLKQNTRRSLIELWGEEKELA